jgi:UDP-N-acetylglucosamine 2-epimerase (non-hydrolysing)
VQSVLSDELGATARVQLIPPVSYRHLLWLLDACALVLTDSGGIQEEAPAYRKPVLVLRDTTERPEGVTAGVARLVGTSCEAIVREASRLLDNEEAYAAMAGGANPYGDGHAAERILQVLATGDSPSAVRRLAGTAR